MTEKKKPTAPPARLVEDGKINHGVFTEPPRSANLADADIFGMGSLTPDWLKSLRFKRWQFFLIAHPRYAIGFVIVDMNRVAAGSFFYVYDREKKQFFEYRKQVVRPDIEIASDLWDGHCHFRENKHKIEIENRLGRGEHEIEFNLGPAGKKPAAHGKIKVIEKLPESCPLVVSLPVGARVGMYSHKALCPVGGSMRIGDEDVVFDPARDYAIMDEHKAYYPRHTFWKWATFGYRKPDGGLIGGNFTSNMIENQQEWNENCIWTPGAISLFGAVNFEYDEHDVMKPWRIHDEEGFVDLDFTPQGVKLDQLNLMVIKMDYRQPYGLFNGTIKDAAGTTYEIKDAFGVTEHNDILL